jgi:hypothetical protein
LCVVTGQEENMGFKDYMDKPIPAVAYSADFGPAYEGETFVTLTFRVPKDTPAIVGEVGPDPAWPGHIRLGQGEGRRRRGSLTMTDRAWTQLEAGWFTSDAGGVTRERDGKWYFHPSEGERVGPFASAGAAMRVAGGESSRVDVDDGDHINRDGNDT